MDYWEGGLGSCEVLGFSALGLYHIAVWSIGTGGSPTLADLSHIYIVFTGADLLCRKRSH